MFAREDSTDSLMYLWPITTKFSDWLILTGQKEMKNHPDEARHRCVAIFPVAVADRVFLISNPHMRSASRVRGNPNEKNEKQKKKIWRKTENTSPKSKNKNANTL